MPLQIGYIDSDGHPKVRIRVNGTNPDASASLEAMIDTGFTGFLMLPISVALPLGLVLMGTGDYTLADGSGISNYLAKGTVTIGESLGVVDVRKQHASEAVEGIIILCGESALVGMEFLRSLKKLLLVGAVVLLMDESDLSGALDQALPFNPKPQEKSN